jgi:hypothetical protein
MLSFVCINAYCGARTQRCGHKKGSAVREYWHQHGQDHCRTILGSRAQNMSKLCFSGGARLLQQYQIPPHHTRLHGPGLRLSSSMYLYALSITQRYSFCKHGCVRACCERFPLSITLDKARRSKSRTHTHTKLKLLHTQLANIREATLQQLEKVEIQYMDPSSRMSCTGSAAMIWPELKHFITQTKPPLKALLMLCYGSIKALLWFRMDCMTSVKVPRG